MEITLLIALVALLIAQGLRKILDRPAAAPVPVRAIRHRVRRR